MVGYAAVLGVAIDLDHFLVARYNAGDWRALRTCLARPTIVLFEQTAIFEPDEVWPLQRLLSHAVLGGALVFGLRFVAPRLAALSALVLYAHVLADLLWDNRRRSTYQRRYARAHGVGVEGVEGVERVE